MTDDEKFIAIIKELTPYAVFAGRAKILSGCEGVNDDWVVTKITWCPPYAVPGWYIDAQYGNTTQTAWTHITPDEVFAWRLRRATLRTFGSTDSEVLEGFQRYANEIYEYVGNKESREYAVNALFQRVKKHYEAERAKRLRILDALDRVIPVGYEK